MEEARSCSMNNDTNNNTNNIHSVEEEEDEEEEDENQQAWGTWEELLLACAVKRHGFTNWDSVATEVRSRSSNSGVFISANNCKRKYRDLKTRFHESQAETTETTTEIGDNIPWLEQLRSLRVAELRREVQRYDVSILSLQLKVKKLEEEREGDEEKPDLGEEEERRVERSENDGREKAVSETAEEEESDRENRSINESNSTASGGKIAGGDDRVGGNEPGDNNPDPDPVYKEEEGSEASQSDELGESGTSGRKWKRKRGKNNHGGSGEEMRSAVSKSQPLIGLLDLIRSHPRGSLFERRLRSQETKEYRSLIKQHLDIGVIQRKLKKGSYDSSSLCFYRDLHLLFTNAIVFFPSSSSESMAAHELRTVVSKEMRKETGKSGPKLVNREASGMDSMKADAETSDSSLSRRKSLSRSLVACKKRKIVSAKASPSSSSLSEKEEMKEEVLSEEEKNNVAGVKSSRRTSKVVASAATKTGKGKNKQKQTESKTNSSNDNNNNSSSSKQETGKTEKKTVSSDKKKSVADFLKRLKKNSPQKEGKDQNKSGGSGKKESKTKPRELRSNSVGKKKTEVEDTPVKRAPGRPQKKKAEAAAAGKRGRESGSTGKDNKQPKKRSRR